MLDHANPRVVTPRASRRAPRGDLDRAARAIAQAEAAWCELFPDAREAVGRGDALAGERAAFSATAQRAAENVLRFASAAPVLGPAELERATSSLLSDLRLDRQQIDQALRILRSDRSP